MEIFNDLIKRASDFVEKQKGVWDHSKWQGFLSDTKEKGIKLTEDTQNSMGSVLESIKKFYESSKDTSKKSIGGVTEQVAKFIEKTKGKWEHIEWEEFVKNIQQKGIDLTAEAKENLGGILESTKKFYNSLPLIAKEEKKKPEPTKTPEKAKPTVKKKAKAKTPKKEKKPVETQKAKTIKKSVPKKKTAKKPTTKKSTIKKPAAKKTKGTKTT